MEFENKVMKSHKWKFKLESEKEMIRYVGLEARKKEMQPNPKVNQASSSKDPTRGAHTALLLIPVNLVKVKDFQAK